MELMLDSHRLDNTDRYFTDGISVINIYVEKWNHLTPSVNSVIERVMLGFLSNQKSSSKKVALIFEFFRECYYIMHIWQLKIWMMSIIETIIYIVGWSTMIGLFNYLESE